ncbi:MAG: 3-phosphoshikimate 1-carboxyvinyltransferase [bacterium]|nr:3-phosphoshikimate 1-carboxyvinyltransferase [bacterium]
MTQTVSPFSYKGKLHVPFSKSYLQRAIAIGLLTKAPVEIIGFTPGNDALAARSIAEALGAKTSLSGEVLSMSFSGNRGKEVKINCGESGLSTRMFSPIAASLFEKTTVEGEGSILVRPMDMVINALELLGAKVGSNDGKLPLTIEGKITSGTIEVDGSESSQLLTGLLIALAFLPDKSEVHVHNLKSIPYVEMTLDILESFDVKVRHDNFETFYIPEFSQGTKARKYTVEGDWSGASFHIAGAALSGEITLKGLNQHSAQADRAMVEAVQQVGASINWVGDELHVREGSKKAFEFDATHCPDLFPPLAALAAGCSGTSIFQGVSRLASKESNRGLTIQSEMKKLGIDVVLDGDRMLVTGGEVRAGTIDSNNDHRIAMMGAILATQTKEPIVITNPQAVNKSYPAFFQDIAEIGSV